MAYRTGIELLPDVCRVVGVQTGGGWFGRGRGRNGASRVASFHEIPYSPDYPGPCAAELRRALGSRRRDLHVAIWGLRTNHQVLYLPPADRTELEQMARREGRAAAAAGAPPGAAADGVMVGDYRDGARLEVGYVSVPPAELEARMAPFVAAGLSFERVVSPAVAHASLVRQRWGQFGDAVTAVLSVNARATAMTVVRSGVVLFTREMPWGHETERADRGFVFDAAAFAGQLAAELRRSLVFLKQQARVDVGHILVCGDLPDLRALTGPLMHELSVEVETLDSLEGFDITHLPEPADQFRARIGALRTAWALAADAAPSINLQPREAGTVRFTTTFDTQARRRLTVAVVVGLAVAGAAWAGSEYFASTTRASLDSLRRQFSSLGPEVQRQDANRRAVAVVNARRAALEAFATQGPRLAKVLEALAKDTPGEVVITSMAATPGVGSWKLKVSGQAMADTPALSQALFNQFLRGATASALIGQPVRPPSISVETTEPVTEPGGAVAVAGIGAGAAARDDEIAPLERPRNVVVTESWSALSPEERRAAELLGRQPIRVMAEPHWHLHPGGVPRAVVEGIANYNAEQSSATRAAARALGLSLEPEPVPRRAGSVLEFTIEFEVRK